MKKLKSLIAITLIFVLMLTLTGCGEVKRAESTVKNMFAAFKALDFEKAQNYVNIDDIKLSDSENELTGNAEMFMNHLFDKLEYKIISSEKVDSNTVHVTTEITAIDMKPVLGDFLVEAMQYAFSSAFASPQPTEEEFNAKMEEILVTCVTKPDLATVTNEVVIKVVKVDKKWKVDATDTFVDALLGGIESAIKELEDTFNLGE